MTALCACRTVGQWNCDYFDEVEALKEFGGSNKEGLAEIVWGFFEYWAWRHDYNNSVISIRTGGFLTKSHKEWTRRVGNERHLVCIEVIFPLLVHSWTLLLASLIPHSHAFFAARAC